MSNQSGDRLGRNGMKSTVGEVHVPEYLSVEIDHTQTSSDVVILDSYETREDQIQLRIYQRIHVRGKLPLVMSPVWVAIGLIIRPVKPANSA